MKAVHTKSHRRVALAALLVLAAFTAPAAAFHDPNLPTIATSPLSEHGAVSHRFTIPEGADIEIEMEALHQDASMEGDGVWLFDSAGAPLVAFLSTGISGGAFEVHLELPGPIGVVHDVRPEPPSEFGGGMGLVISGVPAGEYVALAGSVSNGTLASGSVALRASAGSALVATEISVGGFSVREAEFDGTTALVAPPIDPIFVPGPLPVGPFVRPLVMLDASHSESVERSLFGWFEGFGVASQLTVAGPGGSTSASGGQFFDGLPSGDYTFTVDYEVGVPEGYVWLWGLDAALA